MKIRVQIDDSIGEDEIIIRCRELNADVQRLLEQIQLLQQSTLRHMIGTDKDRQYVLDVKEFPTSRHRGITYLRFKARSSSGLASACMNWSSSSRRIGSCASPNQSS
ncbi:hypothetical protein AZ66_16820 [Paenibacillus sp. E194]|nr:hypothetical protein [Paenibacillus sp. E194]KJB86780.1 hypothetical protein AZ66_16820 [Paenibacillus sp. E194]